MKTIFLKELRELALPAALAGLAFSFVVANLTFLPQSWQWRVADREIVPFLFGGFHTPFVWITALLAAAAGLWQTVGEDVRQTWVLGLHRPLSRRRFLATKLLAGATVVGVVAAVPIVWYGVWAALPRTHASPFEWSMTAEAWHSWLWGIVVYLSAFLSGVRPARWWGTRLFPLIGAAGLWFATCEIAKGAPIAIDLSWLWWSLMSLCLITLSCSLVAIDWVFERRDFG